MPRWKKKEATIIWDPDKQAELLLFLLTSLYQKKEINLFSNWIKLESHLSNYRKIVIVYFDSVLSDMKQEHNSFIHATGTWTAHGAQDEAYGHKWVL